MLSNEITDLLLNALLQDSIDRQLIEFLKEAINYYYTESEIKYKIVYPAFFSQEGMFAENTQKGKLIYKLTKALIYRNKTYKYIKEELDAYDIKICEDILQQKLPYNKKALLDVLYQELQRFYINQLLQQIHTIANTPTTIDNKISTLSKEFRKYYTHAHARFYSKGIDLSKEKEDIFDKKIEEMFSRIKYQKRNKKIATTGFKSLDAKSPYGGLPGGRLYTIMGLPGRGKSTTLLNIALQNYLRGLNVLFITLENDEEETLLRLFSRVTGTPLQQIVDAPYEHIKQLNKMFKERFLHKTDALFTIEKLPLGKATVEDIFEGYLQYADVNSVHYDVVIIDYASRLWDRGNDKERIDRIFEKLKSYANILDIPVITAHQINREGGKKTEAKHEFLQSKEGEIKDKYVSKRKKPQTLRVLNYLYVAGSIGVINESDLVLSIQRGVDNIQHIVYFYVAKARFMPDSTYVIKTRIDPDIGKIEDIGLLDIHNLHGDSMQASLSHGNLLTSSSIGSNNEKAMQDITLGQTSKEDIYTDDF